MQQTRDAFNVAVAVAGDQHARVTPRRISKFFPEGPEAGTLADQKLAGYKHSLSGSSELGAPSAVHREAPSSATDA